MDLHLNREIIRDRSIKNTLCNLSHIKQGHKDHVSAKTISGQGIYHEHDKLSSNSELSKTNLLRYVMDNNLE